MATCDFRCPRVVPVEGSPYPLFSVRCRCGTVCLGNTEELARRCWTNHVAERERSGRGESDQ